MRPWVLVVFILLATLPGCTEAPCVDPATAAAAFDAAKARLEHPFDAASTANVSGILNGTSLSLTVVSDPARMRLMLQGTIAGHATDVRLDGPWVSMRVGEDGFIGRDHAPGSDAQTFLDRYFGRGLPYTKASVDAHDVRCTALGGEEALEFVREQGNLRDALVAGRAPPHRLLAAQHVDPQESYSLRLQHDADPAPPDDTLPRMSATLVLEQVDYQEDDQAYAFRWVVADGTWVPSADIDIVVLGPNGTQMRIPLPNASTPPARHMFEDRAPTDLLSPGDVLSVAVQRDHEVTLYDAWADAYVKLEFR